jgi:cytosine permease
MSESGFIAEGYARQLVPDAQLGGAHRVFFIVAGALCGLPVYVLAAQVVHGMGLGRARYAFLAGGLISGTLGALSAYCGARTRMNLAMLADEAFGLIGGRVVKTVIALSLVGWVGVILSVLGATAGSAISSLYGVSINSAWIAIAAAVAVAGIALHGVRGLEQVGMVISPLLLGLLAWTFYKGCPPTAVSTLAAPTSLGFGAAVSAVVGEYVVGIVIQPDYGRFVRRPAGAGIASGLALGVAFPCILTLSAMPTYTCSAADLIAVMVAVGIGLPAIALLVLGPWIDASACLYSGSLSLTNEVKRFRLPWVTVCSAGIGCVFAICHAERLFMPFLALLGVTFPPVAAINILHTLWPWSERASGQAAVRPPAIRRAGVLAWIAGSVTGYFTSNGYFTVTGIASIDSVLIAAGVWLLVTTMNRARRPGAPWALKKA